MLHMSDSLTCPQFYTHTLANGLQIIGYSLPDAESVMFGYHIRAGARDETQPHLSGISHFLEHMLFKGTQTLDRQQVDQQFNRLGAVRNGSTSLEQTNYFVQVLPECFSAAFQLLTDMMYPRLLDHEFTKEKEVIINEIARSEERAHAYAYRQMIHKYFQNHPLSHLVLGTRESIRDMHVTDMHNYWQQYYTADNMILAIVGKFDWSQVLQHAAATCSTWHTSKPQRPLQSYIPQPTQNILVNKTLKQQYLLLSMPFPNENDPSYYAARLGSSILGRSQGSRLYWQLTHKGLVKFAEAGVRAMEDTGLLYIQIATNPDNAPQVIKHVHTELARLLDQGITEAELIRAKTLFTSNMYMSSERTSNEYWRTLANWQTENRFITTDETAQLVHQVTIQDVMNVFHRFPLQENQVLTAYGPLDEI